MQYLVGPPGDAIRLEKKIDLLNYLNYYFYCWLEIWRIYHDKNMLPYAKGIYDHPAIVFRAFQLFDRWFLRFSKYKNDQANKKAQMEIDRIKKR